MSLGPLGSMTRSELARATARVCRASRAMGTAMTWRPRMAMASSASASRTAAKTSARVSAAAALARSARARRGRPADRPAGVRARRARHRSAPCRPRRRRPRSGPRRTGGSARSWAGRSRTPRRRCAPRRRQVAGQAAAHLGPRQRLGAGAGRGRRSRRPRGRVQELLLATEHEAADAGLLVDHRVGEHQRRVAGDVDAVDHAPAGLGQLVGGEQGGADGDERRHGQHAGAEREPGPPALSRLRRISRRSAHP